MDLQQYLLALRARRKAFLFALFATVIAAVAVGLMLPARYVSQATVLVDARDEQALSPTRVFGVRERAAYVATQVDLMQSGRVARQVVHDLKLTQHPELRAAYESETGGAGPIDVWIGEQLLRKLDVIGSASNLITVQYTGSDPKFAADVANGFAKAYLTVSLELRTDPSRDAAEWFDEQLVAQRGRVEQAQKRLTAFQKEKGIVSVDERLDIEASRLSELSTQLLAARNATYDAQARYRQGAELLEKGGSPDALPEVMASTAILAVKTDLARAEGALQAASADLGPNHPVYQRNASEVKALRDKLAGEMKKMVAVLGNTVEQTRKREQELQAAYQSQQARMMQSRDARAQVAGLMRDLENAQRSHDAVLERLMATRIQSRARQGDAALLTPAVVPLLPAQPRMPLIITFALVLGLALAVVAVYALEMLDRRVRSRLDLESRLAVPSLGRLSRWYPTGGSRLLPAAAAPAGALPNLS